MSFFTDFCIVVLLSQAKSDLLVKKVMAGEAPRLAASDMTAIIKKPWEDAFHPEVSRKGWKMIGFDPATKACKRQLYWQLKEEEDATAAAKAKVGGSDLVLDTRCLQFQQPASLPPNPPQSQSSASASAAPAAVHDSTGSDSDDSGDSDCNNVPDVDNLRLGGEDFSLGPLTYGAGRAKLEERQKRKTEQEAKKTEREARRVARDQQQAEQRLVDAKAGATMLWRGRRLTDLRLACARLTKKQLHALLVILEEPGVKASDKHADLVSSLIKRIQAGANGETDQAAIQSSMKSMVSPFIETRDA